MASSEKTNADKSTDIIHSKISYLKNSRNRISKRSWKNIRPTSLFVERTRVVMKRYLEKVIEHAIIYAKEDKRQSVSAMDIAKALKKQGYTTSDTNFSSNASCPEDKSSGEREA